MFVLVSFRRSFKRLSSEYDRDALKVQNDKSTAKLNSGKMALDVKKMASIYTCSKDHQVCHVLKTSIIVRVKKIFHNCFAFFSSQIHSQIPDHYLILCMNYTEKLTYDFI